MSVAGACLDPRRTRLQLIQPQVLLCRVRQLRAGWRRHADHLLIQELRGGSRIQSAGEELRLGAGDVAWIPAGVEHAWRGEAGRTLYRLRVRLDGAPAAAGITVRRSAWHLQPVFAMLQAETTAAGGPDPLRLRALLALVFSHLEEEPRAGVPVSGLDQAQMAAVDARIAHWRTQGFPSPANLAKAAGLGGDWFARSFRRRHGCSPRAWLAAKRLQLAQAELLAKDASALAVARSLGFAHYAQFARAFRRTTGVPPERWRTLSGVARDRRLRPSADGSAPRPRPG